METWHEQLIVLAHRPVGLFLFTLIIADVVAMVCGSFVLALYQIRKTIYMRKRAAHYAAIRPVIDKLLPGGDVEPGEFRAIASKLTRSEAASIFLEYENVVSGTYRDRLRAIFSGTNLPAWAERASNSRRWWPRLQSVRLVPLLTEMRMVELIIKFLFDRHPFVRVYAIQSAHGCTAPDVIDALFERLADEKSTFEMFALKEVISQLGIDARDRLTQFLTRDLPKENLIAGIEISSYIHDPVFSAPLIGLLDSSEGAVQAAAARALSAYPSREAVDKLSDMLTAENPDTRAMAAYSLGKINNPAVAGALYNAMPDRSWSVRYHCAAALKRLGAPGAEYLNKALSHSDPYVADIAKYVISLPYFALV